MSKQQYTVFVIIGYEELTQQATYTDACEIQIITNNVKDALKQAKAYIKKKNYRVKQIIQNFK